MVHVWPAWPTMCMTCMTNCVWPAWPTLYDMYDPFSWDRVGHTGHTSTIYYLYDQVCMTNSVWPVWLIQVRHSWSYRRCILGHMCHIWLVTQVTHGLRPMWPTMSHLKGSYSVGHTHLVIHGWSHKSSWQGSYLDLCAHVRYKGSYIGVCSHADHTF